MKRILITGATGNIGREVIRFLFELNSSEIHIIAGVRNIEKAKKEFEEYPKLDYVNFDFENTSTFSESLEDIDCIFLLRPPHISDVEKYFEPLIRKIKEKNIHKIIFLSVQGAEKSKVIPHNKIEKLITESGLEYIFLRPSYFMQNLTTTLLQDIQNKQKIILPASKAKFNWIDIENIGEVTARLFLEFESYKNQTIELTGYENLNFYIVTELINQTLKTKIKFDNSNPLRFFFIKKNENMNTGLIMVMIMLHLIPRFQTEPKISNFYEYLLNKKPTTLVEFIQKESKKLTNRPTGDS